jgi:hypothetical protein
MRSHTLFLATALSAAMAVPALAATVSVSPYQAEAGKDFKVTVSGKTDLCMPIWTYISAKEQGGVLTLSAAGANNPLAKCAAGPHDFSLDILVPALKAGSYEVRFQRHIPCEFDKPQCEPFIFPDSGGTLLVVDRAKIPFSIKPRAAAADKSFDLFLTNKDFTCGNTFSNLNVAVRGWQLMLSFTNKPNPAAICPAIEADYGPTFKVPALAYGTYQVFAVMSPWCDSKGPCPLALFAPQLAGALDIGSVSPGREPWTEPGLAPAGMTFGLDLHGPFDCNDEVMDKQVEVKDKKILLHYGLGRNKKLCNDTIFVHHETFTVPGLAVGDYPVILSPRDCQYPDHWLCLETLAPRVIDTVTASSSLGVKAKAGMPGVGHGKRVGVKVLWRGEPADMAGRRKD